MNVGVKLSAFAGVTAGVFALAFGVGSVLDPIAPESEVHLAMSGEPGGSHDAMDAGAGAVALPGLAVSSRGYTLRVPEVTAGRGDEVEVAFTVTGADGVPVRDFDTVHEKEMHFIVVRRDLSGFQHLHPERDADGTWRTPVDLRAAGVYRVFADFSPSALGETVTLGADVFVPGEYTPNALPEPETAWSAENYEVAFAGTPAAGEETELTFTVARDGTELPDLEPYLGAFGHLVSLRSGDLAYLHTHPAEEATATQRGGPAIRFGTTFPTAGRYRLYLNFAHDGQVRTAEFTVEVPEGRSSSRVPTESASDVHRGH